MESCVDRSPCRALPKSSVLSDLMIEAEMKEGNVIIHPFSSVCLSNCSYDVTLGEWFAPAFATHFAVLCSWFWFIVSITGTIATQRKWRASTRGARSTCTASGATPSRPLQRAARHSISPPVCVSFHLLLVKRSSATLASFLEGVGLLQR